MQVFVSTDRTIAFSAEAIDDARATVESSLGHLANRLTRVDVMLSDGSAGRSTGDDIRCRLEARAEGRDPEFVTDDASTIDAALRGALHKLNSLLTSTFGRLDHHKGNSSMGGD